MQDEVFPFPSSTFRVMLFGPTSVQVKFVFEAERLILPQLSKDPPSISLADIEMLPEASRKTFISWQIAVGEIVSITVTIAPQAEALPFISVTVSVILLSPRLVHVKFVFEVERLILPQLSKDPPSISLAVMETFPLRSI